MKKTACAMLFMLLSGAATAWGLDLQVLPGLRLALELPAARWQVSTVAPPFLVEETIEHLHHELEAAGKSPGADQLKAFALKRLADNEMFVSNPDSGSYLLVDFSPLRSGEEAPDVGSIELSARYAGESLCGDEGITACSFRVGEVNVVGAEAASLLEASFAHHNEQRSFVGVVGFVRPYWFFLYYTDTHADPLDMEEMGRALRQMQIYGGPK